MWVRISRYDFLDDSPSEPRAVEKVEAEPPMFVSRTRLMED
jgi:hypothetical protein